MDTLVFPWFYGPDEYDNLLIFFIAIPPLSLHNVFELTGTLYNRSFLSGRAMYSADCGFSNHYKVLYF